MRRVLRVLVVVTLAMLIAAACGDDGEETTSTTRGGGATTEAPSSVSLSSPVKIVLLAEKKGESQSAVPYFFDGASLAVEQLNAKGGVGGHSVEFQQIRTPLDPAGANTALLSGLDAKPSAIIGFPASAQVTPLIQKIATSGVPTILFATAGEALGQVQFPNSAFTIRPRNAGTAAEVARYAIEVLGAKKIGLICVDNPFGTLGCDSAEQEAKKAGVAIVNRVTNSPTATDLTQQVLAMKGADAVLDFNFPNPLGVAANQLVENGIDVPHLDGASSGIAILSGSVRGKAAENLYGVDDCVPAQDAGAKAFVDAFRAKFGYVPNYAAAQAYDAVMLIVEAAKRARSAEPKAIEDALRNLTYKGVCETYRSDSQQVLHHSSVITRYTAEGETLVVKKFAIPGPSGS